MDENRSSMTTWIIVGVVVIVLLLLGWWYFSQPSSTTSPNNTNTTTQTQQQTTQSSAKDITSFSFNGLNPAVSGDINNTNHTVSVTVPKGTDVKKLTPTIRVSDYATVSPPSDSVQDFTKPVTYTVTAEDGSKQNYTVTVTVASSSTSTKANTGTTVVLP
jgi:cytoskeletal protein RodZ